MGLSKDCEEFFTYLTSDFCALRIEWRVYRSLFGTNRETVDLLNEVSGPTAFILDYVLFERTLLGLRKLTDPSNVNRSSRKSVSIRGLDRYQELACRDMKRLISEAIHASEFARDWANRKIAHSDLSYYRGATTLTPASREKVESALRSISDVLKWIARKHLDTQLDTNPITSHNDERQLLRILYQGRKYYEDLDKHKQKAFRERDVEALRELRAKQINVPDWLERKEPRTD